jgi:hypothetical protein
MDAVGALLAAATEHGWDVLGVGRGGSDLSWSQAEAAVREHVQDSVDSAAIPMLVDRALAALGGTIISPSSSPEQPSVRGTSVWRLDPAAVVRCAAETLLMSEPGKRVPIYMNSNKLREAIPIDHLNIAPCFPCSGRCPSSCNCGSCASQGRCCPAARCPDQRPSRY